MYNHAFTFNTFCRYANNQRYATVRNTFYFLTMRAQYCSKYLGKYSSTKWIYNTACALAAEYVLCMAAMSSINTIWPRMTPIEQHYTHSWTWTGFLQPTVSYQKPLYIKYFQLQKTILEFAVKRYGRILSSKNCFQIIHLSLTLSLRNATIQNVLIIWPRMGQAQLILSSFVIHVNFILFGVLNFLAPSVLLVSLKIISTT